MLILNSDKNVCKRKHACREAGLTRVSCQAEVLSALCHRRPQRFVGVINIYAAFQYSEGLCQDKHSLQPSDEREPKNGWNFGLQLLPSTL